MRRYCLNADGVYSLLDKNIIGVYCMATPVTTLDIETILKDLDKDIIALLNKCKEEK